MIRAVPSYYAMQNVSLQTDRTDLQTVRMAAQQRFTEGYLDVSVNDLVTE